MLKRFLKIIGKANAILLAGMVFMTAVNPAYAKIVFKNEFLIEDNGTDTFILDAADDVTGNVVLQFGSSLSETISFNTTDNWFEFSNDINLNLNQLVNARAENLDSAPTCDAGSAGRYYFNTTVQQTYICDGTVWKQHDSQNFDQIFAESVADADTTMNVTAGNEFEIQNDSTSNVIIDLQSTGDLVIQDAGATYITATDTGEFRVDNLQMDANTISSTNANGNVVVDPNGSGLVNLSANTNVTGNLGIGVNPTFNFHLLDTSSTASHTWQVFDNGTDQASIMTGTQNPTVTATNANTGSIFLNTDTGRMYTKADDGNTTNWYPSGLDYNVYAALTGTFGIPGITNKFVTDSDPRLQAITGSFGEVALGTHLDYPATNATIDDNYIYYTRIFLPSDTTVSEFAVFTTQAKTGLVNYGIYSNNPVDAVGRPGTKLAEIGATSSTSPVNDWWLFTLPTPLDIDVAGTYWLAFASNTEPKGHQILSAEDSFVPFRVESKASASATLPATANPDAKGSVYNLPYLAAFEE